MARTRLLTFVSNPLNQFGDFFSATINALESVSDARTISSPTLLVRNNTESSINVGEQLAIANTTSTASSVAAPAPPPAPSLCKPVPR